ncbi:MAG: DegV family EDD domain-containing protein [Bacteroidales bacterium]|nr:DegV family EDD domain-containing protein [Bacteroidales bacterium]
MATENTSTKELDGKRLYYSFLAGAQYIFIYYKAINRINVFPVADGDTGTNLASTLRSIMDTSIPTSNIKVTATALADAALVGARGNSGIIFAQFLYGISNEIKNEKCLSVSDFAEVVKKAVRYAYEAIANPVEGTMITVIRVWADYLYSLKDKIDEFTELMSRGYQKALEALQDTPKQLEVLARANVVDAGAKGFVIFLEGMIDFFRHGEIRKIISSRKILKISEFQEMLHTESHITFRYCTEALIGFVRPDQNNKLLLKERVEKYGDSLVIAGSPSKIRLHIHTDQPARLFYDLRGLGNIIYKKVDDMVHQNDIVHHRKWDIALLTDSTCDLPRELVEKYQIHIVPLTVHFENDYYIDNVTITPDEFYSLLENSETLPTTSQPTYKDFVNKYQFLASHYKNILGLHISDKLSGTFYNSRKASALVANKGENKVGVFSSNKLASSLGLLLIRAAREIEQGAEFTELSARVDSWVKKSHLLVSTQTLKYMIKGGRISPVKGWLGELMGIRPLVLVNQAGKVVPFGKPKSEKSALRIVFSEVEKILVTGPLWGYAITHAQNQRGAELYAKKMRELTGKDPEFISPASPVLGTHTGPGVVAVAILMK